MSARKRGRRPLRVRHVSDTMATCRICGGRFWPQRTVVKVPRCWADFGLRHLPSHPPAL
jgi:hypothetical protein